MNNDNSELVGEAGYLALMTRIRKGGVYRPNRTGIPTRALFDQHVRFDLRRGFPLFTTKKVNFTAVVGELLWFLSGSTDVTELELKFGTKIWNDNAYDPRWTPKARFAGDVGFAYGSQWRSWTGRDGQPVDQIAEVIGKIGSGNDDRRLIVTAWNPTDVPLACLPPCHMHFQFHIEKGYLSLGVDMRSCDMFLGIPFNVASYALLLSMVAHLTALAPKMLTFTFRDAHIYRNHYRQVALQTARKPRPLPKLWLNPSVSSIDGFTPIDIAVRDYNPHPPIRARMAV